MRKPLLIVFQLFLVHFAYSQEKSLLSDFKFRVQNFRAISFNTASYNNTAKQTFLQANSNSLHTGINIGGQYNHLKSTDNVYRTMSMNLYSNFSHAGSKNTGESKRRNNNLSGASFFQLSNTRFYNKFFTLIGTNLSINIGKNKSTTDGQIFSKGSAIPYSANIVAGIGRGRLENIIDMQNALWLYKTLQEEGRVSKSLSDAELNELGRTVTTAKNTRILDARRRNRFVLETVDKYIQQKNILKATDIGYFSALNDILFFAINNQRLSGTQKYVTITPGINIGDNKFTSFSPTVVKTSFDSNIKSAAAEVGIKTYKPINLKHQNNYGTFVTLQYFDQETKNKIYQSGILTTSSILKETTKMVGLNLFFQHEIYPNTRTSINIGAEAEGGYFELNNDANTYGKVTLNGNINYFINYQTVLTGSLNLSYFKNIRDTLNNLLYYNDFFTQFNIGLNINL